MSQAKTMDTMTPLERWLRKNNYSMCELAAAIGCHRHTIGKVKQGLPIEEVVARQIYFVTGGMVDPAVKRRGKPELSTDPHTRK